MSARSKVGPSLSLTLVRINEWLASVQSGGLDPNQEKILAKAHLRQGSDVIEHIAHSLIGHANRTERRLLSKSLQEALYYCVNFEANLTCDEFKNRFSRYVNRYDPSSFLKRFLCLYLFNHVWSETGELFRGLSRDSNAFEKYMNDVEQVCQRAVNPAWNAFRKSGRALDMTTSAELIAKIEENLLGN